MERKSLPIYDYSILFVDDEEKSLKYFQRAYKRHFRILVASNADQAEELLTSDENKIGVLVVDKRMPRRDGIDLIKWAKENQPSVVRIITTAYADHADTIDAINQGEVYRYISKPWRIDSLYKDLHSAMELFVKRQRMDSIAKAQLELQELRIPLMLINSSAKASINFLESHQPTQTKATKEKQTALEHSKKILRYSSQANSQLEKAIQHVVEAGMYEMSFRCHLASELINELLHTYMNIENIRNKLVLTIETDFQVYCSRHLLDYVFQSLFFHAAKDIIDSDRGRIHIKLENGQRFNKIIIQCINTEATDSPFPPLITRYEQENGETTTGIRPFFETLLTQVGVNISYHMQEGLYAQATLHFPVSRSTPCLIKNNGANKVMH